MDNYMLSEKLEDGVEALERASAATHAMMMTAYEAPSEAVYIDGELDEYSGVSPDAKSLVCAYHTNKYLLRTVSKNLYEAGDAIKEALALAAPADAGIIQLDPFDDDNFEKTLADYGTTINGSKRLDAKGYPNNIGAADEMLVEAINALRIPESKRKEFDALIFAINGYVTVCEECAHFAGVEDCEDGTSKRISTAILPSRAIPTPSVRPPMPQSHRRNR